MFNKNNKKIFVFICKSGPLRAGDGAEDNRGV